MGPRQPGGRGTAVLVRRDVLVGTAKYLENEVRDQLAFNAMSTGRLGTQLSRRNLERSGGLTDVM
jgi:hypothetical protein